jgi:hypothetical protein
MFKLRFSLSIPNFTNGVNNFLRMTTDEPKIVPEWVVKTQMTLGSLIERPRMLTTILLKPPFRFLHDCVLEVNRVTGVFAGVFEERQLDYSHFQDKQSKVIFLQRLLGFLNGKLPGTLLDISIGKILAGLEPDKTNKLLLALYEASQLGKDPPTISRDPCNPLMAETAMEPDNSEILHNPTTLVESIGVTTRNLEVLRRTFIPKYLDSLSRLDDEFQNLLFESQMIQDRLTPALAEVTRGRANTVAHCSTE